MRVLVVLLVLSGLLVMRQSSSAQTIEGRLLDVADDRPIELGLVILMTEGGDSVDATVSDEQGRFAISSDEPGRFILLASAWGYGERAEGVFELGEGGWMSVDFRIRAQPLELDELLVGIDQPVLEPKVVRIGFVRRMQRGLGIHITPHEIEQHWAVQTTDLFMGRPGVHVSPEGGVFLQGAASWCSPRIYLDGILLVGVGARGGFDTFVPLGDLYAVEIYRRPSEVPLEYSSMSRASSVRGGGGVGSSGACGVILVWTK